MSTPGYEPQGAAKSTGQKPGAAKSTGQKPGYTSLFYDDTKPRGTRLGIHTKDSLKEAQAQALRLLRTSLGGRRKFRRQSRRTRLHKRKTRRH